MTTLHGFEIVQDRWIAEFNTRARLWRHQRTGTELLSLENDDDNKVFGIVLRTPPADSTGIAHIMEHSVLCGSQKYPVKEPFIELIKGSLNTFLNAFTYPDKTCYPVASTNLQDFYNLIDVYLDAVFHPLITEYTLHQEGWHYELESPDQEMTYKGVVFNEMKGDYSSADSVLSEQTRHAIYPDIVYGLDSGGDPEVIPNLTYDQFRAFHETFYHPSNARIFFYGNDDPQERLRILDQALQGYDRREVNSAIPIQPFFSAPRTSEVFYDSGDDPDARAQVCLGWMLPQSGDVELTLALAILSHALVGTPASPLRKALIDSGLGEDLTGSGLESELRQMMYSVGLKGIQAENGPKIEQLILATLSEIAEKGLDKETVAASMNTIEFHLRENNTGSFPRGLALMLRSLDSWLYDFDPIAPLAFETPLNAIKKRLGEGQPFFENLVREHFLANPHRVTVLLRPDPELGKRKLAAERERLDQARAAMSPEQIQEVIHTTHELKRRQETPDSPEALATIPLLKRSDLETRIKTIPTDEISHEGSTLLYHDLFTNGVLYLDLGFNLRAISQQSLPYIPLFSRALLETGTADLDFVQLVQRIGQRTGGIHPSTITSLVRSTQTGTAWLVLRAKAMTAQTADLLAILKDVLTSARLDDRERIRQIALENKAGLESGLIQSGHRVINTRLKARMNEADGASEVMNGLSQLFFLRDLLHQIDSDWPSVEQILESIRAQLIDRQSALLNVTIDGANFSLLRGHLQDFLADLPENGFTLKSWKPLDLPHYEGLTLPAQVNYVGKGANIYNAGYRLHGSAFVITPYLRGTYLWDKIRVQGGAYGGFAAFDQQCGAFNYLSYRDPNLDATLDAYDQAAGFLRTLELSENELTKAIIGAIGEVDAYQLPDARGYTAMLRYLLKINDEERQVLRDQILATTQADFHAFADVLEAVIDNAAVVVLGSQEAIQASQTAARMTIQKVM